MVMQIEMPFVSPSASTAESATHCVRMSHGETERMKIGTSTAARSNEKSSVAFGVHGGRAKAELEALEALEREMSGKSVTPPAIASGGPAVKNKGKMRKKK